MHHHRINADLTLELLEEHHSDELFALVDANREHLREWLPWIDGTLTSDDTRTFIASVQKQLADDNGFSMAIRWQQRIVGVIGVHHINWSNRFTSVGYWLAKDAQGNGIVTQACQALNDHLFGELNLNRVEIRCAVDNGKSRAIPERLGFTSEGVARNGQWLNERFVDLVVYALLAADHRSSSLKPG